MVNIEDGKNGKFRLDPEVDPEVGSLPYLKLEFSIASDHFKVGAIGRNQPGAVRPRGKGDEDVEMHIAELVRRELLVCVDFPQYLAGLQPVFFCRSQDGMVPLEGQQEFPLCRLGGAAPQLRQDHGRCPDEAGQDLDSGLMTGGTQVINDNRGVEDDQVTHDAPRTRVYRRVFSSSP